MTSHALLLFPEKKFFFLQFGLEQIHGSGKFPSLPSPFFFQENITDQNGIGGYLITFRTFTGKAGSTRTRTGTRGRTSRGSRFKDGWWFLLACLHLPYLSCFLIWSGLI